MPAIKDLTGMKFGHLKVLERVGSSPNGKSVWKCLCDCGRFKEVISGNLVQARSLTCGICYKIPHLLGKKIGNLTVKKFLGVSRNSKTKNVAYWECEDDRGFIKKMRTADLIRENRTSRSNPNTHEDSAYINLFRKYKAGAKKRNLEFALTYKEFKVKVTKDCTYCKGEPSNLTYSRKNAVHFKYNGIDRIDNKKGYTLDNCTTCCIICNRAKSNLPIEVWEAYLKRMRSIR